MLVIKIFLNFNQIDEVHIKRIGKSALGGNHLYRITKPVGFSDNLISHLRTDGYAPLVAKVYEVLVAAQHKTKEAQEYQQKLGEKKKRAATKKKRKQKE